MDRGAAGYNPWGHMESGTTEHTQKHTEGEAWGWVGGRVVRREDSVRRKMMSFRGQVTHRGCADHHVQSPCLTSPGLMVGTGAEAVRPLS